MTAKWIVGLLLGMLFCAIGFSYMYYTEYEKSRQAIRVLNATLNQWKEDYKSLLENYTSLSENYNKTLKELYKVKENLNKYIDKYNELLDEKNQLEEELSTWKNSKKLRRYVSLNEIKRFLKKDDTDEMEYDEFEWNCADYSSLLVRRLAEEGIFACVVYLLFEDGAHAIVVVETEPGTRYYIEPQTDKIIPDYELYEGVDYCDVMDWDCSWVIEKISSCSYISTYDGK